MARPKTSGVVLNEEELWVGFARDAMSNYEPTGDADDLEDLVNEMVEVSSDYADAMLDEHYNRFGGTVRPKRRKARKSDDDEDD